MFDSAVLQPLLGALKLFGLDPASLLAGVFAMFIATYVFPLLAEAVRQLIEKIRKSPTTLDDAALPILESIEAKLSAVKEDDPGLREVTDLIAVGVIDAAKNKKDAKRIAAVVVSQLEQKLAERIKSLPAAEQPKEQQ